MAHSHHRFASTSSYSLFVIARVSKKVSMLGIALCLTFATALAQPGEGGNLEAILSPRVPMIVRLTLPNKVVGEPGFDQPIMLVADKGSSLGEMFWCHIMRIYMIVSCDAVNEACEARV